MEFNTVTNAKVYIITSILGTLSDLVYNQRCHSLNIPLVFAVLLRLVYIELSFIYIELLYRLVYIELFNNFA